MEATGESPEDTHPRLGSRMTSGRTEAIEWDLPEIPIPPVNLPKNFRQKNSSKQIGRNARQAIQNRQKTTQTGIGLSRFPCPPE
jgi:hypothetical protein